MPIPCALYIEGTKALLFCMKGHEAIGSHIYSVMISRVGSFYIVHMSKSCFCG